MRDKMATLCSELYRSAQEGDIDYRIGWIASGFTFARNSCRVSGEIEMRLRELSRPQARALIMRAVRDEKITMGDVPSFLNRWFYGVDSTERQAI